MKEGSVSKFTPNEGYANEPDVIIDMPKSGRSGSIEEGLGIQQYETRNDLSDPDVEKFMMNLDGQEPADEGDEDSGQGSDLKKLVEQLTEQNKHLASKLGQQGNEVVGPLRKEVEELRRQLTEYQSSGGGRQEAPDGEKMLRDTIRNLYGAHADPTDEVLRFHAQAHINAANSLGEGIQQNIVGPLQQQIAQLKQQLAASERVDDIPTAVQRQFAEQYPNAANLPRDERESMLRMFAGQQQQGQRRSDPDVRLNDPAYYVERSTPTAPMKSSQEAASRAFQRMSSDKMEQALGAMLARRGARALGLE